MAKRLPVKRVRFHAHIDQELYAYFSALRYSPTEGRIKYGFSDLINRLLREERARHIARAAAAGAPTSATAPGVEP